jgi:uncharacterized protein DUF4082
MSDFLWSGQVPALTNLSDAAPGLNLGTLFYVTQPRVCTGIQWRFPDTTPAQPVKFQLWNYSYGGGTETIQASGTFAGTEAAGYFSADFTAGTFPFNLPANTVFVASIWTPDRYVATNNFFQTSGLTNGDIVAPQNGTNPVGGGVIGQGVFTQSASVLFPSTVGADASYFPGPVLQSLTSEGIWGVSL